MGLHVVNFQPFFSTVFSASAPLPLVLGSSWIALFPFVHINLCLWPSSFLVLRSYGVSLLLHGILQRVPLSSIQSFSLSRSHICFNQVVSISQYCQHNQVEMHSPSSQLRHRWLPLAYSYLSFSLRGISTFSMDHNDSFALSFYEWALCLLTSFPFSNLATLRVKPRLSSSSWRDFIHPLMLSSSSWEALWCLHSLHLGIHLTSA